MFTLFIRPHLSLCRLGRTTLCKLNPPKAAVELNQQIADSMSTKADFYTFLTRLIKELCMCVCVVGVSKMLLIKCNVSLITAVFHKRLLFTALRASCNSSLIGFICLYCISTAQIKGTLHPPSLKDTQRGCAHITCSCFYGIVSLGFMVISHLSVIILCLCISLFCVKCFLTQLPDLFFFFVLTTLSGFSYHV